MDNTTITIFLPVVVAAVAGVLRQDKLPAMVNESISYALVFGLSLLSLYADGKLSTSFSTDYPLMVAYTSAMLNSPLIQPLQGFLQSKVLSFGKATDGTPTLNSVDIDMLVTQLLPILSNEVTKYVRLNGDKNATAPRPTIK